MQRAAIILYNPKLPGAALFVLTECYQNISRLKLHPKSTQTNSKPPPEPCLPTPQSSSESISVLSRKKRKSSTRTHSQLLGQLEAEEARELEEALRLSAQEAMERQKQKHKVAPRVTQERGEPSTVSVTPRKRKASSDIASSQIGRAHV